MGQVTKILHKNTTDLLIKNACVTFNIHMFENIQTDF